MCSDEHQQKIYTVLHDIDKKLATVAKRPALEQTLLISSTQPLVIDFKNRRHLFLWSANTLTLTVEDLGNMTVPQATWVNIGFQEGMRLTPTAQASTIPVFVRATDEIQP